MFKHAFTLAEVLITLAIIGVVAAITIPSVIANNQKQELVSSLQKAYNTINQAVVLSQAENGSFDSWPWEMANSDAGKKTFIQTYLIPYLKILKDCNTTTNQNCWAGGAPKFVSGGGIWADYNTEAAKYKISLQDGSSFAIDVNSTCISSPSYCAAIVVDTNGQRGPNTVGRDVFQMFLFPFTNQVAFQGTFTYTYSSASNSWPPYSDAVIFANCNPSVSSSQGETCGTRIQREGWKMNY